MRCKTERVGHVCCKTERVGHVCCKSERVGHVCCKTERVGHACRKTERVGHVCCKTERVGQVCCKTERVRVVELTDSDLRQFVGSRCRRVLQDGARTGQIERARIKTLKVTIVIGKYDVYSTTHML